MADLSVLIPAETKRTLDWIYGAARNTAAALRSAGLLENPSHLTDTLTLRLNPQPVTIASDALRLADGPVALQLTVLEKAVTNEASRVADGPIVAQHTVLEKAVTEAATVADTLTPGLTPLVVVASSEVLKVAETLAGARGLTVALAPEGLSIDDTEYLSLALWPPTLVVMVTRRSYYQGGMGPTSDAQGLE